MPKYWGKQIFTHGRFPEVGQKQKTEKKRRKKVGDNNGQATHGARKPPGPILYFNNSNIFMLITYWRFSLAGNHLTQIEV